MENNDDIWKAKYLKYKHKYMKLKEQEGGNWIVNENENIYLFTTPEHERAIRSLYDNAVSSVQATTTKPFKLVSWDDIQKLGINFWFIQDGDTEFELYPKNDKVKPIKTKDIIPSFKKFSRDTYKNHTKQIIERLYKELNNAVVMKVIAIRLSRPAIRFLGEKKSYIIEDACATLSNTIKIEGYNQSQLNALVTALKSQIINAGNDNILTASEIIKFNRLLSRLTIN
jgi:hypothetical protein